MAVNCTTCRRWLIHVAVSILGWQNASKALFFDLLNFLCPIKVIYIPAPLIHDIPSGSYNAQLVALGPGLRWHGENLTRLRTKTPASEKDTSFLKNTSKEKWGCLLSLHELFNQNFYPAASDSPMQLSFCNPLPQQTWAHISNVLTHNTGALYTGTASQHLLSHHLS